MGLYNANIVLAEIVFACFGSRKAHTCMYVLLIIN